MYTDRATLNGHVYTTEAVEQALSQVQGKLDVFVYQARSLGDLVGEAHNIRIEDGKVLADIVLHRHEELITSLGCDDIAFTASGTGDIDESGNVSNYRLLYVNVCPAKDSAVV